MIGTASVVRAFLAAFGGPIGIAITAITFLAGNWLTSVDQATAAINEHKRQVDIVVAAYNSASDKAGDWAKKISGVTVAQALASLESLKRQFDSATNTVQKYGNVIAYAFQDFPDTAPQVQQLKQLQDAIKGLSSGTVTVKQFEDTLNAIALNPTDEQFKQIALQILNLVNNTNDGTASIKDLADSIGTAEAQIRLMNGTATDADKAMLGLGKTAAETAQNLDYEGQTTKFNKILNEMRSNIPGVADELKKLGEIDALKKAI